MSGQELDSSDYQYFSDTFQRINENFEDEDDKKLFVKNIIKSIKKKEIALSCHSKLSRLLEKLFSMTNGKQQAILLKGFSKDFSTMSTHSCASHVMQACLENSLKFYEDQGDENTHDKSELHQSILTPKIVEYGEWVSENLELVLTSNNYGPHVICTLLETLSGYKVSDQILHSKKSKAEIKKASANIETPEEFKEVFKKIIDAIQKFQDIKKLIREASSSSVLQAIILITSKCDREVCQQFIKAVNPHLFTTSEELGQPMKNPIVTPLIEKVIDVATPDQLAKILKKYFKGNFKKLSLCPNSNYLVQRLIKRCSNKEEFEVMYDEMGSLFNEISNIGHLGVLTALSETCARLNHKQVIFTQGLAELLQCWENKERKLMLVPCLVKWKPYDQLKDFENKTNYYGSVILQNMFNFQKPLIACDSFLNMDVEDLIKLSHDPCGSHVMDSFVQSKTVGEKRRSSLIEKLKGKLAFISCDKFGSRCIETLWRSSDLKLRLEMAKELSEDKQQLRNHFGYFVYNLCQLDLYKSNSKQWKYYQSNSGKRNVNEDKGNKKLKS